MNILIAVLLVLILCGIIFLLIQTAGKSRGDDTVEELSRLRAELKELKSQQTQEARANRSEITASVGELSRTVHSQINEMNGTQLQLVTEMTKNNGEAAEQLRLTVDRKLKEMADNSDRRLEEMRRTVDERLENTLEHRLNESFGQVSERLEQVNRGLGEIKGLSSEMTDVRKLFSNVKTRGIWGEVQLSRILEDCLPPGCFVADIATGDNPSERVEYAVCLPGRDGKGSTVYLPIDSKFPAEDYRRLTEAEDAGNAEAAGACRRALEKTLKSEAKMISDKYIAPPKTLNYGIMFLPAESLFAEALRLPGFMEFAEQQRVMVAGPSNLSALLNSIAMGFKTLVIEEKSSEIRNTLVLVRKDMNKFAEALEKARKKIAEADKTIGDATHRTEILSGKLDRMESTEYFDIPETSEK